MKRIRWLTIIRNVELVQVSTTSDGKASDGATIVLANLLCVGIFGTWAAFIGCDGHGSPTEASDESFEGVHDQEGLVVLSVFGCRPELDGTCSTTARADHFI